MDRRIYLMLTGCAMATFALAQKPTTDVAVAEGKYAADWESLSQWECPEWFKNAKFGIWAHWGPQCQAEDGDWYARNMYFEGTGQYNWHCDHFGDPEVYGLKELIRDWKAENWNPEELIKLYSEVGAKYFFTLGQHHDNFDLWNSPYQEWNSVNLGPKRDIVKEWSDACKKYGLPLGVSMHGSHTWTWMEKSQDYDGNLTKEDGTGQWWEGYDPQELYAQRHAHSTGWDSNGNIHGQWNWTSGASLPDAAYKTKFQNRVLECINDYQPDMLYFDDTVLPFYGCDDAVGLNILSHYYNTSAKENGGVANVVTMGKILENKHKEAMLWDVERGVPDNIQEKYWQTCTCIGSWHYDVNVYNNSGYKSAQQVIDMLVDIVSKNGNLLLSVPIKGDGTIDDKEREVLAGIKEWMDQNGTSIYSTRPWKTFGEGPLAESSNPLTSQGFNEGNNYTSADVRYAQRNDTLFATIMRWPSGTSFTFESLGLTSQYYSGEVKSIELLGHGAVSFTSGIDGVTVSLPEVPVNKIAPVFAITFAEGAAGEASYTDIISLYEQRVGELSQNASYTNTGKLSRTSVNTFALLVEDAKAQADADSLTRQRTLSSLATAYEDLMDNGRNAGGEPDKTESNDITEDMLLEYNNFAAEMTGSRFGTPVNWTVENYGLEQTNAAKGVKNGIDNYSGASSLMLGVWSGEDKETESDLSNARIYRTVHLEPGRYYFGASYNQAYNLSDEAYIFAASKTLKTGDIPEQSIAYYNINKAGTGGKYSGILFNVTEAQDVVLGFQANLLNGSNQQEFRVDGVTLLSYGEMNLDALEQLVMTVEQALDEAIVNDNTGFYSSEVVAQLRAAAEEAQNLDESSTAEEVSAAYNKLKDAYDYFLTDGRNEGGSPVEVGCEDITVKTLKESTNFERTEETQSSGRFGAAKNWIVENFGFDNQAGIDNNSGTDCLHLEVWWNSSSYTEKGYDMSNVRLYQKALLPEGRYFFGASYPAFEPNEDLYIFASGRILNTEEISTSSIAFEKVNKAKKDGSFRGIYFTLDKEQEVYLGFQADFSGCQTNNLRASAVKLLYYGNIDSEKLSDYVKYVETSVGEVKVNDNTGYYSTSAMETLQAAIDAAKDALKGGSSSEVIQAYNSLAAAYDSFLANGKNEGGTYDEVGATDLTETLLLEANKFSRVDGQSTDTRYGTPKNWTVENYSIPSSNGTRNGLDRNPGYDCLTLGIWDDRNNAETDMTNARVYRTVHLSAGRYWFGATYDANYQLSNAYIYASDGVLATSDISTQSIAYDPISNAGSDNKTYRGIYFTLDSEQDVQLGFQANLADGPSAQEFRASNVKLLRYGNEADAIVTPSYTADENAPEEYYTLTGIKLSKMPQSGLVIVRKGSRVQKVWVK